MLCSFKGFSLARAGTMISASLARVSVMAFAVVKRRRRDRYAATRNWPSTERYLLAYSRTNPFLEQRSDSHEVQPSDDYRRSPALVQRNSRRRSKEGHPGTGYPSPGREPGPKGAGKRRSNRSRHGARQYRDAK